MNGILVVDKPAGFTSHDVVAKLRGICGTRKIGHGGTLDPMATGVLPVFVEGATKAVDLAPNQDKTYEAEILFGMATDTGDVTGQVLRRQPVALEQAGLLAVLNTFLGPQLQTPPMYSAVKVDGRPLYKYAREGKEVERKARPITIYEIVLLEVEKDRCRLRVACSKGTYIRTLAEDIGAALAVPAALSALRRTAAGIFAIKDAHTLEEIQAAKEAGTLESLLRPVGLLFEGLPALPIDKAALARLANGVFLRAGGSALPGRYRAMLGEKFCGIVNVREDGTVRGEKLFWRGEEE